VLGDPANATLTEQLIKLGWRPPEPRLQWDPLPVAVQASPSEPAELFELPRDTARSVALRSARFPDADRLGLRWWAVPVLTNFCLDLGGVLYPCCPFNGWFQETEVARDLADRQRYNVLPELAALMKLDVRSTASLWRDYAMLELCRMVLDSPVTSSSLA
jgi:nitric oxide synthase oxygenase domain/subunit